MSNRDDRLIWCPEDFRELITIDVDGQADDAEFNRMMAVNGAANDWLNGKLDNYTYFELLDHYGIEPIDFIGEAEYRLSQAMR